MLITPAFAQSAGGAGAPAGNASSFIMQLVPFAAIIAIFYFLIIRPQQQRMKQHREMVAAVRRGDTVVTAGGVVGKVTKVVEEEGKDAEVELQIAETTRIRVVRSTLAEVRKGKEPVAEEKK
jgi:preprotein translocase subunit YajC